MVKDLKVLFSKYLQTKSKEFDAYTMDGMSNEHAEKIIRLEFRRMLYEEIHDKIDIKKVPLPAVFKADAVDRTTYKGRIFLLSVDDANQLISDIIDLVEKKSN